ncbi:hypothetical protein pesp048 [Peridroma alphabaculovirus]|uniref:Ac56 n=1 Tax=Peridroma alphabaculovirus TaxID=1346829 RepID=A0A068LKR2_9ABAC|nr:hypothetical protein pesp048 [Peridroma alphabaculovirus]AIE47778.1 hypothetical protein pesp048 [Peridroma alphabaculovirus]
MSSASATSRRCLTKKNTSFNEHRRRVDLYDGTVHCTECMFVAPLSASYEEFIQLHRRFNRIVGRDCRSDDEVVVLNLIKLSDDDTTV